jgi:hypothetical protein
LNTTGAALTELMEAYATLGYRLSDSEVQKLAYFLHEARGDLERVKQLIEGFETPYGMELLSTVHWVVKHEAGIQGVEAIREKVESWNKRKKDLMKPQHIQKAYSRLEQQGWVSA